MKTSRLLGLPPARTGQALIRNPRSRKDIRPIQMLPASLAAFSGHSVENELFDHIHRITQDEWQFLALSGIEIPENEIPRRLFPGRASDTHPDPHIVAGTQGRGNRP